MYFPAAIAITATVPWFATYLAEDSGQVSDDLVATVYFCVVGLLISLAALLDDAHDLTAWFGIASGPNAFSGY
jgi:hypothetical protein